MNNFVCAAQMRVLASWQDHQRTKQLNVRGAMGPFFCLRQRMLHFLQNFVYYMTVEVISQREHELQRNLSKAKDMDEVILATVTSEFYCDYVQTVQVLNLHEQFLFTCLQDCLLGSQQHLNLLMKIMTTSLVFADHVKSFMAESEKRVDAKLDRRRDAARAGSDGFEAVSTSSKSKAKSAAAGQGPPKQTLRVQHLQQQTEFIRKEASHETFTKNLLMFEQRFDSVVNEFLEKLWKDSNGSHPKLVNLCVRLDYNGFYSSKFLSDISSLSFNQSFASTMN
jgi:gamma-tubulin complex component 2